jgi:hypothetical protein
MTQWGLDTLFNPAKRHMDEEKRRLQSTREEIGDSSGGKRIDLESGKVRIERTSKSDDDTDTDGESQDGAARSGKGSGKGSGRPAKGKAAKGTASEGAGSDRAGSNGGGSDGAGSDGGGSDGGGSRAKREPSPAAIRAAQRRGRTPRAS